MKLIVILSLIILNSLVIASSEDVSMAFKKDWCGSSKINVELITKGDKAQIVTKASIVIPSSLVQIQNAKISSETVKVIPKTDQGLILNLVGPAVTGQIDIIYRYDQDTNADIFIPYAYIENIVQIDNYFSVQMSKTFKSNTQFTFLIQPTPDEFGTNLCECQLKMFQARLMENYLKRYEILGFLSTKIVAQVNEIRSYEKIIKKWEDYKISTAKLTGLQKSSVSKEKECDTYRAKIAILNTEKVTLEASFTKTNSKLDTVISTLKYKNSEMEYYTSNYLTPLKAANDEYIEKIFDLISTTDTELRNPPAKAYKFKSVLQSLSTYKISMEQIKKKLVKDEVVALNKEFRTLKRQVNEIDWD